MAYGINNLRPRSIFQSYGPDIDYGMNTDYMSDYQQSPVYTTHEPDPYEIPTYENQISVNDPRSPTPYGPGFQMGSLKPELPEWLQMLRQLDNPETAAVKRFDDLIANTPQRQSPGWGRTLTAMAVGMGKGDVEAGQKVIDRPYEQDLGRWKEQMGPAYQAANLERQSNAQERTLLSQGINSQIAQRKIDEAQRKAETELAERTRSNKANEDIRMIHAKAAELRARGYKTIIDGNRIIATNPQGEKIDLGPSTGMTKYDEIMLRGEQAVRAAEAGGEAALVRAIVAAQMAGQNAINLKTTPSAAAPPRQAPDTATERVATQQELFTNIWNFAPQYRKFLERDVNGKFTLMERPEGFGPDAMEYDQMAKAINPAYQAPSPPSGRGFVPYLEGMRPPRESTPPTPSGAAPPSAPVGRVGAVSSGEAYNPTVSPTTSRFGGLGRGAAPPPPPGANPPPPPATIQEGPPPGRITVYDAQGRVAGHIPNTPEQLALAASQGLRPVR